MPGDEPRDGDDPVALQHHGIVPALERAPRPVGTVERGDRDS